MFKKLALKYLCDVRQDVKDQIVAEIDARSQPEMQRWMDMDRWNDDSRARLRAVIRGVIEEFVKAEQARAEPAYKAELMEERKRREQLEQRVNELVEENQRSRQVAEEAERSAAIRAELQRLGVAKVDLAYQGGAGRDSARRRRAADREDGRESDAGVSDAVRERESGAAAGADRGRVGSGRRRRRRAPGGARIDLDKIRPGMSPEELDTSTPGDLACGVADAARRE